MRLTAEAMSFVLTFFQGIRGLNSLAKKLRAKRMEAGALMLASTEVKFVLDADSSDPLDVQVGQGWLQASGLWRGDCGLLSWTLAPCRILEGWGG